MAIRITTPWIFDLFRNRRAYLSRLAERRVVRHPTEPNLYIDASNGLSFPYYTRPTLEYLISLDLESADVLELGGGRSSLWWRHNCKSVLSLETDPNWARRYSLELVEDVFRAVDELPNESFDIVIVDGDPVQDRDGLASLSIPKLRKKKSSMLIVDNFNQASLGIPDQRFISNLASSAHSKVFHERLHRDWKTAVIFPTTPKVG